MFWTAGPRGLTGLRYGGRSLLAGSEAGRLRLVDPVEEVTATGLPGRAVLVSRTYRIAARYRSAPEGLDVRLEITRRKGIGGPGPRVQIAELTFPSAPRVRELDAGQFGLGGKPHPLSDRPILLDPRDTIPLIHAVYDDGAVAFGSLDPSTGATLRVPEPLDRPANRTFQFQVQFPPLPPGSTVRCRVAFRVGSPGASVRRLAGDVLDAYTAAYPYELRWPDRRPIGELFLASAGGPHPAANPRGWFNAADVDVTTPGGRARFRKRLLRYADDSVRILNAMHAQGMVTWDPEGEEYAGATYYGDPTLAGRLAPETESGDPGRPGVLDEYFERFRRAGLRVGVCIRPQEIRFIHGQPRQIDSPDPAATLIRKMRYARRRWGCTLFYLDSTVKPNGQPLGTDVVARAARAMPGCLLMPENETLRDFASAAPLNSFQHHTVTSTPPGVLAVYPRAFSVLLAGEGDIAGHRAELVAAVRRGDILLFHGWWNNPNNALIRSIYVESSAVPRPAHRLLGAKPL